MSQRAQRESIFASADMPADAALAWLIAQLDAQAERGDPQALTPEQRRDLRELLGTMWWRTVFAEDREAGAEDPKLFIPRALPPAVRAASALPQGGLVLALYLRNLVNDAWSMAWDHELLVAAIESACAAADGVGAASESSKPERKVSCLGWALLRFMLCEFHVETALLTGRLGVVVQLAEAAVAEVAPLVEEIEACAPSEERDALHQEARNELIYYQAVRDCAALADRMLRGDRADASAELDSIRSLIDSAALNQMDLSELRGHLAAADFVNNVRDRKWLHVDTGRVHIIYPFGIRLKAHENPVEVITGLRNRAEQMRVEGTPLGALPIIETRGRLDLGDVWQGTDNFGRGYRGATLRLGDVVVETGGAVVDTIRTRIQFSHLGNHAIHLEIDLDNAPAYRVAEALRLATPVAGDLSELEGVLGMRTPSGQWVSGLPDVIDGLLDGVREMLDLEGRSGGRLSARDGSFGVAVTIVEALSDGPQGREELRDARALMDLWGVQPILHPLPSGVASIADWVLHDLDAVDTWPILHLNGELLASSSNMTLLASFSSPEFAVNEMESYIEFAHSMHGMYQGWQDSVRYFAERIAGLLREAELLLDRVDQLDERREDALSERRAEAIADLNVLVREIERTELSLQSFVQSNEAVMLFIESPDIVSSPSLRQDLDTILASNGYDRLRDGFTRAVRDVLGTRLQPLLSVVHHRMEQEYAMEADRIREDLARRNSLMFEIIGVVFAVVGFSGLASILQAGSSGWGMGAAWWLVIIILALAGVIGIVLYVVARRDSRRVHARQQPSGAPRWWPVRRRSVGVTHADES